MFFFNKLRFGFIRFKGISGLFRGNMVVLVNLELGIVLYESFLEYFCIWNSYKNEIFFYIRDIFD